MKNVNTLSKLFAFLFLLVSFMIVGCQKDNEFGSLEENVTQNNQELAFRTSVLQLVYGISDKNLDHPSSEKLYQELMQNLDEEQMSELEKLVAEFQNKSQSQSADSGNTGVRSTGNETIINEETPGSRFGASIANEGNTLFVGAPGSNKVLIYKNGALEQTLSPSDGSSFDFGTFVAASNNWLAVAATTNYSFGGQVYLFKKQGNSWVENDILDVSDLRFFAGSSGTGMVMHGNTLAVMLRNPGTEIRIFKLTGNNWSAEQTLAFPDAYFWDIAIHGDLIVTNGSMSSFGLFLFPKVFIFENNEDSWGLEDEVAFPFGDYLARAVAVHNSTVIANTFFRGGFSFANLSNSSIVITKDEGGAWSITGELLQPEGLSSELAQIRELSVLGSKAVVTYPTYNNDQNDAAHVFEQSGGTWNLTETLTPSTGGFGIEYGVSVIQKGNEVIIGSPEGFYLFGEPGSGAVFIYN